MGSGFTSTPSFWYPRASAKYVSSELSSASLYRCGIKPSITAVSKKVSYREKSFELI